MFNVNSAVFQLYHDENKLIFNVMMMSSVLYWNNGPWIDMSVALLGHIIMIPSQPVFALSP